LEGRRKKASAAKTADARKKIQKGGSFKGSNGEVGKADTMLTNRMRGKGKIKAKRERGQNGKKTGHGTGGAYDCGSGEKKTLKVQKKTGA